MEVSLNWGYYSIFGSTLGFPYLGKLPYGDVELETGIILRVVAGATPAGLLPCDCCFCLWSNGFQAMSQAIQILVSQTRHRILELAADATDANRELQSVLVEDD